jgi:hypothetical protein
MDMCAVGKHCREAMIGVAERIVMEAGAVRMSSDAVTA